MNEAKLAERVIQLCPELMGENRRPSAVVRNPRTVLALVELIEDLLENDAAWRVHSSVLADQRDRLRADLDECYQDLLTETVRANTVEERNDRLQAVVDAANNLFCWSVGMEGKQSYVKVTEQSWEQFEKALAALEDEYTIKVKGIPSKLEPPEDDDE